LLKYTQIWAYLLLFGGLEFYNMNVYLNFNFYMKYNSNFRKVLFINVDCYDFP
jgi:hypothetical protein